MAGDWIKIEHTLPDKPEVVRMAMELGIDQDAVAGKLLRIWTWADQNTVGGNDIPVTNSFLDRLTAFPGFAVAMRKVGWLEGREGSLSFPRFDRHNGQTAKLRAETNRRVAKSRAGKPNTTKGVVKTSNDNVTEKLLQKPLPEKRREESITPDGVIPPPTPPAPTNAAVVGIDSDGDLVEFDRDPVSWVAEFVRQWNQLSSVRKHDCSALSHVNLRALRERLSESDWYWRQAFAKFPLHLPNGTWAITLGKFLEPDTVSKILDGRYERTAEQVGLFNRGERDDPTKIRTGDTAARIADVRAQKTAERLRNSEMGTGQR